MAPADDTVAANTIWADACLSVNLFVLDPAGLGGIAVRSLAGPVRDGWLHKLKSALPENTPLRRIPLHITDSRLLGGLDLAATLQAGRPIAERGILAEADGGIVLLAMAERLSASTAARLTVVMDANEVVVERDGVALSNPARIGIVALDEGMDADERPPAALLDRLAFILDFSTLPPSMVNAVNGNKYAEFGGEANAVANIAEARQRLASVTVSDEIIEALCAAASSLGIASIRAPMLAVRAAKAVAALDDRVSVNELDAALAARLVLGPRATVMPQPQMEKSEVENADVENSDELESKPEQDDTNQQDSPETADEKNENTDDDANQNQQALEDTVLAAAEVAIPAGLLAALKSGTNNTNKSRTSGRVGLLMQSAKRGRPIGVRRGVPRAGQRLNVIETLRAAAPWQKIRRAEMVNVDAASSARIQVRRDDFHIARFKERAETTTLFVVDASGSAALHRLAEAKGAVELLLADCYVRRDRVALISFRGKTAELLLPPTRSLVRAKRSLASLPGGGGTPLAAAIDAAIALADASRRRGETPTIVMLTDGRANISRDGSGGRARAEEEAISAARAVHAAGISSLLVDTSAQPHPAAAKLATEMNARYLPLPHAGSALLSTAIKANLAANSQ